MAMFTTAAEGAALISQRCENARQTQDGWQACCPAHDDRTPSLSITPQGDRILVHCHAGCAPEAIVAALGMTLADLFVGDYPSRLPPARRPQVQRPSAPAPPPPAATPPAADTPRVTAIYVYEDAQGAARSRVLRWEPGFHGQKKSFTQQRSDPDRPGHWLNTMDGVTTVLYNLPAVLRAVQAGELIYLPEGEKDAKNLIDSGLTATTNPGGAAQWEEHYTETLRGAHVVILQDNDASGCRHTAVVTRALHGVAASLKVVEIPELAKKGDVSDWLQAGGTRAQLEALVQETPRWAPGTTAARAPASAARCWEQAITAADFLAQQEVELAATVRDLVIPGCITVVSAPRASGKSLVALSLAVSMASGGVFRGERLQPQRVLLCDRDNPPALVRKRLRAFGAQTLTSLKVLTRDHTPPLTEKGAWAAFPVDQVDVVLIDSLGAATEGVSEKEGKETQHFLATLKDLARRGPAVLALDNTQKSGLSYRGRGEKADAVDILYECRNVTGWTPTPGGEWWESLPDSGEHAWQARASRRHGQAAMRLAFIPSKFRLGIEPDPFVLEIDTRAALWTLQEITEQIAQAGEQAAVTARQQERHTLQSAIDMLTHVLHERRDAAPILKAEGAALLQSYGLSRKQARTLLESGGNAEIYPEGSWILRPIPEHPSGKAIGIYLARDEKHGKRLSGTTLASNNGRFSP